jgi:hypothetical protein
LGPLPIRVGRLLHDASSMHTVVLRKHDLYVAMRPMVLQCRGLRAGHLERQPRQAQLREQWTEQPTERGLPVQVQVVEAPGAVAVVVVWVHHRGRPGS